MEFFNCKMNAFTEMKCAEIRHVKRKILPRIGAGSFYFQRKEVERGILVEINKMTQPMLIGRDNLIVLKKLLI